MCSASRARSAVDAELGAGTRPDATPSATRAPVCFPWQSLSRRCCSARYPCSRARSPPAALLIVQFNTSIFTPGIGLKKNGSDFLEPVYPPVFCKWATGWHGKGSLISCPCLIFLGVSSFLFCKHCTTEGLCYSMAMHPSVPMAQGRNEAARTSAVWRNWPMVWARPEGNQALNPKWDFKGEKKLSSSTSMKNKSGRKKK